MNNFEILKQLGKVDLPEQSVLEQAARQIHGCERTAKSPGVQRCTRNCVVIAILALSLLASLATSPTAGAERLSVPPTTVWLCRPGQVHNPCETDIKASTLSATGVLSRIPTIHAEKSKFDCFYVYPTVSLEPMANANLEIQPAETQTAIQQAAQFSQVCQVWAPMYRQVTLEHILTGTKATPASHVVAYNSLLSGWRDFLANHSDSRPIILIGHSQGAEILTDLIQSQIDNNQGLRSRLVSAILLGGGVQVPIGKLVGGSFEHIAACTSNKETGCVIAYSTYPNVPPIDSKFARTTDAGQQVLCTNPAALTGGSAALKPLFPTEFSGYGYFAEKKVGKVTIPTPWVEYLNLYRATCKKAGNASWLKVSYASTPGDDRPVVFPSPDVDWGYHTNDVELALGNLIEIVASQESAYIKK